MTDPTPVERAALAIDREPGFNVHDMAYAALRAALDVDEMAETILARYLSFDPLSARGIAEAVRAHLLGGGDV